MALFRSIPPGSHLLVISYPGFYSETVAIEIQPEDKRVVTVQLHPALADELTITATRLESRVSSLPSTVTVVDQSTIEQQLSLRGDLASVSK